MRNTFFALIAFGILFVANVTPFEHTNFEETDLDNFLVDMAGVAFFYDYGFLNVIKALEPDGDLRLSWVEVQPFIKKDGLLASFLR